MRVRMSLLSIGNLPLVAFLAFALVALAAPVAEAAPHHGTGNYDFSKTITLNGTATSFDWANPHCLLHVDVKEDSGKVDRWTLEMAPPTVMVRKGWTKDSVKPGDQISVETHPAKNGLFLGISSSNTYILKAAVNGNPLPAEPPKGNR